MNSPCVPFAVHLFMEFPVNPTPKNGGDDVWKTKSLLQDSKDTRKINGTDNDKRDTWNNFKS